MRVAIFELSGLVSGGRHPCISQQLVRRVKPGEVADLSQNHSCHAESQPWDGGIDDVVVGCAMPKGVQDYNIARLVAQRAGLPDRVPAMTINRFCSSGLQTVATAANTIACGQAEVIVAGGVESMSMVPMATDPNIVEPYLLKHAPDNYISMGMTAEHVAEDLDGKIDMILDGGAVDIGLESTILDMTVTPPMILRPGAITAEMFEELIGEVSVDETLLGDESKKAPKAPGMKYRHYAPRAKLLIVEGDLREEILAIRQLAYAAHREGRRIGVIATSETLPFYKYGVIKNIGTRENEKTIARSLYRVLREFDEEDVETIYSESFAVQGMGKAIMNRLEKAAGHLRISAAAVVKQQRYRRITFVSRTDSARAPMAAEILRQYELKQEYVVDSRGLVVLFPEPANQKAEAIMKSARMTLGEHVSRQFGEENLQEDTLILTIDENQKNKILSEYGTGYNVYTLNEFVGDSTEIPDPYGQPLTAYGECFEVLRGLVKKLAEKLDSLVEEEL